MRMPGWSWTGAAVLALGLALGAGARAEAQTELTVIVYGGSFEAGWKKAVIEPFEKANPDIKVAIATGLTLQNVALMRAQRDNVKVDVIMMDEVGAARPTPRAFTSRSIPRRSPTWPSSTRSSGSRAIRTRSSCT